MGAWRPALFSLAYNGAVKRPQMAGLRPCPSIVACGLVLALAGCGEPGAPAPPSLPRHLVLITIDTLRADRVGAYGYSGARTPVLDEVARGGVRFERAFAPAPITLTSHASLLTGLYPPGHGARHNGMRVKPGTLTLAAHLRAQGRTVLRAHGPVRGAHVVALDA